MKDTSNVKQSPESFSESFSISIFTGRSPLLLKPTAGNSSPVISWSDVTDIPASFVADPFMIRMEGKWYLFMEVLNRDRGKGEIGLATSDDAKNWEYQRVVLKEDYHLSYPLVFEHEGSYYMTPETLGAQAIRLYKANNFPYDWIYQKDLAKGQFSDPTLFQYASRWWMFAGSNPYQSNTLNLFFADDLMGEYTEHPLSPIIENDNRHARPAGRITQSNNTLIRLCQDCYPVYGSRVRAFEITELSTTAYKERELSQSPILKENEEPGYWNSRGMHHVDAHQLGPNDWIACVDGHYSD